MLRVARQAIVVIEPYHGVVGNLLGTTWEIDGDAVNYVFRWNRCILEQATYSYLQRSDVTIICRRLWDHASVASSACGKLPPRARVPAARMFYGMLAPARFVGNMMVGVVVKPAV